ncbi:MAG: putative selenium-dependent hydroxylase accessory protein YqeC [Deltaproteobacteria bacterium]|nr:putative selenium-dependent hydroxylase accessory protein YqeC [Deltaproteobacteria bacterium]
MPQIISNYKQLINIIKNPSLISFVGAGGKTTTMFNLAKKFKKLGNKVLITTTTKILFPSEDNGCDTFIFDASDNPELLNKIKNGTITCLGKKPDFKKKIIGSKPEYINKIFAQNKFDIILVEADGAKQKPIKASAEYEPIIPQATTTAFGIIGIDAIGTTIEENNVHRAKIFCQITNSKIGAKINEKIITKLILSKKGLFAKTPVLCQKILLLNKARHTNKTKLALNIANKIKKRSPDITTIII